MSTPLAPVRMHGLVLSLLALVLGSAVAPAAPLPALDVAAMTRDADLIVVGRADRILVHGASPGAALGFWIGVDRVLKADRSSALRNVRVRIADIDSTVPDIAGGTYGLFFLRQAPGGGYSPADSRYPMLPAVDGADHHDAAAADPITNVANELAQVVVAPNVGQGVRAEAVEALQAMPYANAGAALRAAAATSITGRLWALSALFGLTDVAGSEALDGAKLRALEALMDTLVDPAPDMRHAVSYLAIAMQGRLSSPKAVGVMAALLHSREPAMRRAAASVLGDLKTAQAIQPLARLALDDEDPEVRAHAMTGLADLTGQNPVNSGGDIDDLRYWRDWSRAHLR